MVKHGGGNRLIMTLPADRECKALNKKNQSITKLMLVSYNKMSFLEQCRCNVDLCVGGWVVGIGILNGKDRYSGKDIDNQLSHWYLSKGGHCRCILVKHPCEAFIILKCLINIENMKYS